MKSVRFILVSLLTTLLLNPFPGHAEDIDLYSGLSGAVGLPNVLIVLDTAANADANGGTATCSYIDGGTPSMAPKLLGLEQCAIYNVIYGLPTTTSGAAQINMGMMFYNASGLDSSCNAVSNIGGCLIRPLSPMSATGKAALLAWIKSWTTAIKSNGEATAQTIQEAWAYYAGNTGVSGRNYASIKPTAGCQKNFVVFIGNAYGSNGGPGDGGLGSTSLAGLLAAAPGVTATQKVNIVIPTGSYGLPTANPAVNSCGTYTMGTHSEGSGLYADEWARYMYQSDLSSTIDGVQNIITYTIAALGPSCKPDYPALLTSTGDNGGGKYYATNGDNSDEIAQALLKILNEVQAVNSVFAASSLPVSVNAQGTYLNQIYMGMFRPDANGLPRWVGNLKQYQFGYDPTTQKLSLVDSLKNPAISGAGTGFIASGAVSFWTTQNLAVQPDLGGGFWRRKPLGDGLGYDSPDGELVEKGGAAQVSHLAYLLKDYTTAAGTSTNPRNVYTYCPGNSSCNANLINSANAFATTNTNITAGMFGTASYVGIANITHSVIGGVSMAMVTTSGNHGFNTNDLITITGATPTAYNGTFTITVTGTNTFNYPVVEYPPTPATGLYQTVLHNTAAVPVSALSRSVNNVPANAQNTQNIETVTVTAVAHGFVTGDSVNINNATPGNYNGTYMITNTGPDTFTYPITITPPATATGSYSVAYNTTPVAINNSILSYVYTGGGTKSGTVTVTTTTNHGFVTNDWVTIAGVTAAGFNGSFNITKISSTKFSYLQCNSALSCGASLGTGAAVVATVNGTSTLAATPQTLTGLTRTGTAYSASPPYPNTATATIGTANRFATGDVVNIVTLTPGTNETLYTGTAYTITCATTACTTFTYKINASPSTSVSGTITAQPSTVAQYLTSITRTYPGGTTATATVCTLQSQPGCSTATIPTTPGYNTGNLIDISKQPNTTLPANEGSYVTQTWTITCVGASPCTQFTYGSIALTPGNSTVSGTASKNASPNKDPLINWVRGEDNFGDEPSPDPTHISINIRPSLHGDVLHSRPTVINYGGTIGVVVFYGANDGVFRAVNGNQTAGIGSVPAGGELWSFIPTEFFGRVQRMHDNSPVLLLSTTPSGIVPPPQKKDYFVDGSTSVYQKINASGTTDTAYIYLSMRRGGQLLYALDVTDPTAPKFKWAKNSSSGADYTELSQSWSTPKVAFVKGYCGASACSSSNPPTPVLIFGGGYDIAEDSEPPATDTDGRGIFIVDAEDGHVVWMAQPSCTGAVAPCQAVTGMNYSIPSDITLIDRTGNDGYIDRLYAVDTGGNIWRVDLEPTTGITPNNWKVTQLAALGCNAGVCASGATPRKFFYPVDMVSTTSYDAVLVGSGDREHPLYNNLSYSVTNRFYMVKDTNVGNNGSDLNFTQANLTDITDTSTYAAVCAGTDVITNTTTLPYDGSLKGYYVTLCPGEKAVNAPLTVAGYTYFGTNQPKLPSANVCADLGVAKGYRIKPLTGESNFVIYDKGGLPPSPVAGLVSVKVNGKDQLIPFCIGCGGNPDCVGKDCKTPIGGGKPTIKVPTSRSRTYWYKESD